MKDTNLCRCNMCDSILIDENPQTDSPLYDLKDYPQAKKMVQFHEDDDWFWGCPECKTDAYLQDEILNHDIKPITS